MLGKIFAVALVAIGGAACIDSSSVQCSFGLCPPGSTCDETAHTCIPPGCGDGVINGIEQCDGNASIDPNLHDCSTEANTYTGTLACSSSCTFDTSDCKKSCGDHVVNGPELCDGVPPIGETCSDYGFQIGRLGCTLDCAPGFGSCGTIGWHHGHGNAIDELHAIWGSNPNDMFAVGRQGAILHSDGLVWIAMTSPTLEHLDGVWGTSATNVLAVGTNGAILHYDGTAWTVVASGTVMNLHAVSGTKTDVWVVGDGGTILHAPITTSGGYDVTGAFAAESSGVVVNLRGVWGEASTPIAVGDAQMTGTASPIALARTAGTWTAMTVPTIQPASAATTVTLNAVWGDGQGYVAVGTPTIAAGPPHGSVLQANLAASTTWSFTGQSLAANELRSVWGVTSMAVPPATGTRTDIYIGGFGGTLLHYTGVPGSAHFRLYESNTTRGISGLWGVGPAFVRASTLGGLVQDYDGTDVGVTDVGLPGSLRGVWQDVPNNIAIAVGDNGAVVRRNFTGWLAPQVVGVATLNAVLGFGMTVFVAGAGLAVSGDEGVSFGAFAFPAVTFTSLWGTSATDAWAVGEGGAIARFTGSWAASTTFGTKRLNGIWGASNTDIFVVGNGGTIGHFDGVSWTAMTSPVPQNLNAVWGASGSDVFVVGGAGVILHYDGTTWHRMTSGTGQDLGAIHATSHADIFVGGRGTILKFGGAAWLPIGLDLDDVAGLLVQKDDTFMVGNTAVAGGGTSAAALILGRTQFAKEAGTLCSDPWDNDYDGLLGCADPDCAAYAGCKLGGTCGPTTPLACGETTVGASTFTGIARIDDLPCLDHATPGPEASYQIVAPTSGTITVTLDDPSGLLDLAMLDPIDPQSVTADRRVACSLNHCTAATAGTSGGKSLTFDATANEIYYILVDGPANMAAPFTLTTTCP